MDRNVFEDLPGATLVTALLAGIAGVVGSYAFAGYTEAFVAAPITSSLTERMPAALLRFAIGPVTQFGQLFGIEHLGQQLNLLLAMTLAAGLFASLTLAALATGKRLANGFVSVGVAGALVWISAAVLTGSPAPALGAGLGAGAVVAIGTFARWLGEPEDTSVSGERREVLGGLASALGVGLVGYVLGNRGTSTGTTRAAASADRSDGTNDAGDATDGATAGDDSGGDASNAENAESAEGDETAENTENAENAGDNADARTVEQYLAEAERRSLDVDGLEELISGEDFYEVDIQNVNPNVPAEEWSLSVTGAVGNELELSYDDVTSMDRELRYGTLRCVSDTLNGSNMDNDLWTGVPMERLLEGVDPQGKFVMLRSTDGYYEEFELDTLMGSFLAYGKNGGPLPQAHGYPARALVPGHWGEISVKWLDEIEVLDGPQKGFWEKRGWHGTGPVNTVAKLHATNRLDDGRIQVAGHTYAGTRGIKRVEVSTDGGGTWNRATLSEPLPSGTAAPQSAETAENAWRQWAYTYESPGSEHEVVVRAIDGTGDLQPRDNKDSPFPNGAAGWVSKTVGGGGGLLG